MNSLKEMFRYWEAKRMFRNLEIRIQVENNLYLACGLLAYYAEDPHSRLTPISLPNHLLDGLKNFQDSYNMGNLSYGLSELQVKKNSIYSSFMLETGRGTDRTRSGLLVEYQPDVDFLTVIYTPELQSGTLLQLLILPDDAFGRPESSKIEFDPHIVY